MKISIPNKKYRVIEGDLILPTLDLSNPCPIKIEIRNDSIFLYIGPRDWQWDFDSGKFVGCGTRMNPPK